MSLLERTRFDLSSASQWLSDLGPTYLPLMSFNGAPICGSGTQTYPAFKALPPQVRVHSLQFSGFLNYLLRLWFWY